MPYLLNQSLSTGSVSPFQAPPVGAFQPSKIFDHFAQTVTDVFTHLLISPNLVAGTERLGQVVVEIDWKPCAMNSCVVKPVKNQHLFSFNRFQQTGRLGQFSDAHMRLHVVRVHRKKKSRVFILRCTGFVETVEVLCASRKLFALCRSHSLAAHACCLRFKGFADYIAIENILLGRYTNTRS